MITLVDEEKETFRISPQGGQVMQNFFKQFILDQTDLEFFKRYNNGVEANYLKYYRMDKSDEKDPLTKKLRVALGHIKDFLYYLDSLKAFSPHIKDLWDLIQDALK